MKLRSILLSVTLFTFVNVFSQKVETVFKDATSKKAAPECQVVTFTVGHYPWCCRTFSLCLPGTTAGTVNWNFGDGTTGTSALEEEIEHCFCPGTYSVSATHNGTTYDLPSNIVVANDCNEYIFDYNYSLVSFSGCNNPWNCSDVCSQVIVNLTDNSTPRSALTVQSIAWEAKIFNNGVYQSSLFASGSSVNFTFNEWHSGIRIVIVQTIADCSGDYPGESVLKIDCFTGGDDEQSLANPPSAIEKNLDLHPYFDGFGSIYLQNAQKINEDVSYSYLLFDLTGKLVATGVIDSDYIDLANTNLPGSIYILHIIHSDGSIEYTGKIPKL